jgi:hypothetical protein
MITFTTEELRIIKSALALTLALTSREVKRTKRKDIAEILNNSIEEKERVLATIKRWENIVNIGKI